MDLLLFNIGKFSFRTNLILALDKLTGVCILLSQHKGQMQIESSVLICEGKL